MESLPTSLGLPAFAPEQLRTLVADLEAGRTETPRAWEPVHGPWIPLTYAVMLASRGQRARARAAVRRALEHGAASWFVKLVSARIEQSLGASQRLEALLQGALEQASTRAQRVRVLDARAEIAAELGWHREALDAVEQALSVGGSAVERHLRAAEMLRAAGDHARVMSHLRAVLWLAPEAGHYLTASRMLRALKRWDEARAMAREAKTLGDPEEQAQAAEELLRAEETEDVEVEEIARETLSRLRIDDPTTVEAAFDRLLLTYPGHPGVLTQRAELYMALGRYGDAARDFSEAIREDDTAVQAAIGRAAMALCEGSPKLCLRRLQGIDAGPWTSTLRAWRGEALRCEGRLDEAIEELEGSKALCPWRAATWINLSLARGARGESDAVVEGFERVRRSAPGLLADAATAQGVELERVSEPMTAELARTVLEACLAMMRGNRASAEGTYLCHDGRVRSVAWREDASEDGVNREALKRARELLSWGARGGVEEPVRL